MMAPSSWTSSLQNREKSHFCHLSHLVCGVLLRQSMQTKTFSLGQDCLALVPYGVLALPMVSISSGKQANLLWPLLAMLVLSREEAQFGPSGSGVQLLLHSVPGHCPEPHSIPAPAAGPWPRPASSCPETPAPRHRGQSQGVGLGLRSCLKWGGGGGILGDCPVEESPGPSPGLSQEQVQGIRPPAPAPGRERCHPHPTA